MSSFSREFLRQLPGYDPFALAEGFSFDEEEALRRIDFIETCCPHIEGTLAGAPFKLLAWERCFAANLFGWKRPDGSRRYREALLYLPRKNGKSPFAAAIGHAVMFLDDEAGQQNILAAADRDQASILFRHMAGMIAQKEALSRRCRVYKGFKSIEYGSSFTKVVSSDAATKHGGNLHLVLFDELHAQPDRELYDVLATSQASANRKQPLMLLISTADFDRPSICNEVLMRARAVRDNPGDDSRPGYDPAFLPAIWEATTQDDWTDEKVWHRVNPSMGEAVSLEYLRRECVKAQEVPAFENTFRRLNLNIMTEQSERWLNLARWDACTGTMHPEELRGQRCYLGVDLSSSEDLSACVAYFPGSYSVLCRFYWPEDNLRRRAAKKGNVPYDAWVAEGLLTATPGNTIDQKMIMADIDRFAQTYDVTEVCLDRWGGRELTLWLQNAGMPVALLPQTTQRMDSAMQELQRLYLSGQLRHGGHPILRWNAANLAVEITSDARVKPSKKRSYERIDGISALVTAMVRALEAPAVPVSRLNDDAEELYIL